MRKIFDCIENIIYIFIITFCAINFISYLDPNGPIIVNAIADGNCMFPVIESGQSTFFVRTNSFKVGDIVIISDKNNNVSDDEDPKLLVKRVVAMAGDTVESIDGIVYINGKAYISNTNGFLNCLKQTYKITLKENECFVIGDNFAKSYDSRAWDIKPVPYENITHKFLCKGFDFIRNDELEKKYKVANTEINKLFSVRYEDGLAKVIYKKDDKYYQCFIDEDNLIYKKIPSNEESLILLSYNDSNEVLSIEIYAPEEEYCVEHIFTDNRVAFG